MRETKKSKLKLTSRGRYAVMAMVDLAGHEEGTPLSLSTIAERGNLSLSYLEQLFAALRRHGLVKSHRGPGGGYVLARPAKTIMISEILIAAEDSAPGKRSAESKDERTGNAQTQALWGHLGQILQSVLSRVTLQEVAAQRVHDNPHILKLFETLE